MLKQGHHEYQGVEPERRIGRVLKSTALGRRRLTVVVSGKDMPSIELHGVYKVRAPQPCYIVEITIHDSETELKLSSVVYNVKVGRRNTEQVPFEEHFLSADGQTILGDCTYGWDNAHAWVGDVRLAFLMHYLTVGEAIETPHGRVIIPEPSKRPERLRSIKYVSPY